MTGVFRVSVTLQNIFQYQGIHSAFLLCQCFILLLRQFQALFFFLQPLVCGQTRLQLTNRLKTHREEKQGREGVEKTNIQSNIHAWCGGKLLLTQLIGRLFKENKNHYCSPHVTSSALSYHIIFSFICTSSRSLNLNFLTRQKEVPKRKNVKIFYLPQLAFRQIRLFSWCRESWILISKGKRLNPPPTHSVQVSVHKTKA